MAQIPVLRQPAAAAGNQVIEAEDKIPETDIEEQFDQTSGLAEVLPDGRGTKLQKFLAKWKVFLLLKAINICIMVFLIRKLFLGTPDSCKGQSQSTLDTMHAFYLLYIFGIIMAFIEASHDCGTGSCCDCNCVCCPCLDCGPDCGWTGSCCFGFIEWFLCTCTQCKYCSFCDFRNCFYYEFHNPLLGFCTIVISIGFTVWYSAFRAAVADFRKDGFKDLRKQDRVCYDEFVGGFDAVLSLSLVVVLKIVLKILLGLAMLYDAIKARGRGNRAGADEEQKAEV